MMTVLMKQFSLDADDEYNGVALVILSFFFATGEVACVIRPLVPTASCGHF